MTPPRPAPPHAWRTPALVGLAVLLPLLWCWHDFTKLFYFEDELDLIDLRDHVGFLAWAFRPFAENFVPIFKLAWGGAIALSGGSYLTLVVLLWLNHALNTALLSLLLLRHRVAPPAVAFAALLFGLTSLNLETLGWSVQWSAVQSLSFFLLGLVAIADAPAPESPPLVLKLALCALASPLCFTRGVLTGPIFALALLCFDGRPSFSSRRLISAAIVSLPSIAVALVVALTTSGNQQHISGHLGAMLGFAWHYFAGSPLHTFVLGKRMSFLSSLIFGTIKLTVILAGLRLAGGRLRALLLTLAAFDIGNALLLGLGRYHTGPTAALSSRYQYAALLALLPFLAVLLNAVVTHFSLTPDNRPPTMRIAIWTTVAALAIASAWRWPELMHRWQSWRGADIRAALALPPEQAPADFSRLPWLSNDRTRELVQKYGLH